LVNQPERSGQPRIQDVASFLRERGWRGVSHLQRISHGEWSRAFSFGVPDEPHEYVVRFSAVDEDFRKDQFATQFASPSLPVPRLIDVGESPWGGFYAISKRVGGVFLDDLSGDELRGALPSLFDAMDGMRQADIAATRGFGLWDAAGQAPHASWRDALVSIGVDSPGSRIAGWRRGLARSPTGTAPFDTALGRLRRLTQDVPNPRHLVHSDLLNFNVLVNRNKISAVLDWGSAMYGDWLWDVGWFVFWQPWYPAWTGIDFAAEARQHFASIGVEIESFDLRMRCCAIAIGLDNQAYCAYRGEVRWEQLESVAHRTLALSE
jgi:hygromycin-B 4-O-kinase